MWKWVIAVSKCFILRSRERHIKIFSKKTPAEAGVLKERILLVVQVLVDDFSCQSKLVVLWFERTRNFLFKS